MPSQPFPGFWGSKLSYRTRTLSTEPSPLLSSTFPFEPLPHAFRCIFVGQCDLFFLLSALGEGRCQTLLRKEVKIKADDPWQEFCKAVVIWGVLHHTVCEDY